ncbi:MAG: DMT family transporter [Lachnospiraceae bacterium]|nr:DMT family transporter [Lachnospiraceae bacterium]
MKKNYIFAFITILIWASMATMVKLLLADIPNLEALAISSVFAFLFLLIINIKTGKIKEMKQHAPKQYGVMAGLGFLGLFLYSGLYYYGIGELSSQEACILNYLWPMMIVLFSCLILKERVTVLKCVAMVCSFLGIVILSLGKSETTGGNNTAGMVACIVAAACYGLFSVLNKKKDYDQNITMMVIWLTVAVCAFAVGPFLEDWVPVRGMQWIGIIWLGVMTDAVAYLLWALALKGAEDTAKIANLAYLTPFLSVVCSALVLKEKIKLQALVALVLIIGGILLQSLCERKKEK